MSRISKSYFNEMYKNSGNFIDYGNAKAMFKTKMAKDMKHNGELVEVLGLIKGRDTFNDRYIVRFEDGKIEDNVMFMEINFDYDEKEVKHRNKKNNERSR